MRKALNPFDDEDDDDAVVGISDEGENEDIFHDTYQGPLPSAPFPATQRRVAPLNFDNPFDQVEDPALTFDPSPTRHTSTFVSPLESALMEDVDSPAKNTGYSTFSSYHNAIPLVPHRGHHHDFEEVEEDEITEGSALLGPPATMSYTQPAHTTATPGRNRIPVEIDTSSPAADRRRSSSAIGKRRAMNKKQKVVLKELASGENDEFTMDYKYILLEDLGTASSWVVLLLPYVAFFLALLLESSKGLKVTTIGPLAANQSCPTPFTEAESISSLPLMMACHTSFDNRMVDRGSSNSKAGNDNNLHASSYTGVVFDSGALAPIPVLSTDFIGDIDFQGLSSRAVALVSKGVVEISVLVSQQLEASTNDPRVAPQWSLTFSSPPKTLTVACRENDDGQWYCRSPRSVDVVFSMPDSAVYGGGHLRVNVFFSLRPPVEYSENTKDTILFVDKQEDESTLESADVADFGVDLLLELVTSSAYTFEHMSPLAMKVDTGMRLGTFLASLCFIIYWCNSMRISPIFSCCARKDGEPFFRQESPWPVDHSHI